MAYSTYEHNKMANMTENNKPKIQKRYYIYINNKN